MTTREIVRQLRAAEAGCPLPRYSTKHLKVSGHPLLVSFIRMAGESRPWGVAFGPATAADPTIMTAGDGRNREAVTNMLEGFAHALLAYCKVEGHATSPITTETINTEDFPQLWLPGARQVEMLHFLEYAYSGVPQDADKSTLMPTFARLCGWLFRHSSHPGQQLVVNASDLLRTAYVYPADPVSISSLAPLVAWLHADGGLQERRAAAIDARQDLTELSLDPRTDSKVLEPLVSERQRLRKAAEDFSHIDEQIHAELAPHLRRRWELTAQAIAILNQDPRPLNSGAATLVHRSLSEFVSDFQRQELGVQADPIEAFTAHPETDYNAAAAASAYLKLTASAEAATAALLHEDAELLQESIELGSAVRARVTDVNFVVEGGRRKAIWTVHAQIGENTRVRPEEKYALHKNLTAKLAVVSTDAVSKDVWVVQLRWNSHVRNSLVGGASAPSGDLSWIGHEVILVPQDNSGMATDASFRVHKVKNGPGAWLTHSKPHKAAPEDVPSFDVDLPEFES